MYMPAADAYIPMPIAAANPMTATGMPMRYACPAMSPMPIARTRMAPRDSPTKMRAESEPAPCDRAEAGLQDR